MLADLPADLTDAATPTVTVDADAATGPVAYGRGATASACLRLDLAHETRLALHADAG